MAALAVMYIFIFSGMSTDIEAFKNVLNNMPDVVKKLLSIYVDSISTLEGFYSFIFVYIVLCGAVQAMNLGLSIISKEIRDKTADFLLTKPVSRKSILTNKILAAITSLLITNIVYLIITICAAFIVSSNFNMKIFLMISVTLFFVQLMFVALGIIVAVLMGKIRNVISVSLSIVFGFFMVSMLGSVIGDKAVRYVSPFKYFDLEYIVKNGAYEVSFMVIGAIFVIASIAASYVVYLKKDIHAV
jgi:hypothetical protein